MSTELEVKVSINSEEEEENTEYKVTLLDLLGTIFGLIFYVSDIFSDIIAATWFFQKGYYLYGAFTIVSMYLATVIDIVVSSFRKEFKNLGSKFWLQYMAFSLVNAWGIKIIFSLIVSQYRAYKSQLVTIDIYMKIEQKNLRVAWLKLYEAIFETLPQICLFMYLFGRIEELRSFKLPFVSEYDELQTTVDLFDVAGLLLTIKLCYFYIAVYVNLYKILRIKMSTMTKITIIGCGFISGGVRAIFSYPYHCAMIIVLHVSVGGICWYRNIYKKNQSVDKRSKILTGTYWFIVPFCSINYKRTFLALYIIHLIDNSVVFLTFIGYLTYLDIFFIGVLQAISLVCWIALYFCYFEETGKERNEETLFDEGSENLTIYALSS